MPLNTYGHSLGPAAGVYEDVYSISPVTDTRAPHVIFFLLFSESLSLWFSLSIPSARPPRVAASAGRPWRWPAPPPRVAASSSPARPLSGSASSTPPSPPPPPPSAPPPLLLPLRGTSSSSSASASATSRTPRPLASRGPPRGPRSEVRSRGRGRGSKPPRASRSSASGRR